MGVHIADVSYFVKENTRLDDVASSRATSVYLVQKVSQVSSAHTRRAALLGRRLY